MLSPGGGGVNATAGKARRKWFSPANQSGFPEAAENCADRAVSGLRSKLSKLVPGDIIHGRHSAGPSLTCLVEAVEPDRIETRRITTQRHITFDIETGVEIDFPECRLDSIEPLLLDVHNVMMELD